MNKNLLFYWVAAVLGSCAPYPGFDGNPRRFIERARGYDLRLFGNVFIEVRNERDGRFHYYHTHTLVPGDTLNLPAFAYFDLLLGEDSTYWADIYKLGHRAGVPKGAALRHAKAYAQDLDGLYVALGAINVSASQDPNGSPDPNGVITFTLGDQCRVFYLKKPAQLRAKWQGFFRTKVKVDSQWYYDCQ